MPGLQLTPRCYLIKPECFCSFEVQPALEVEILLQTFEFFTGNVQLWETSPKRELLMAIYGLS